MRLVTQMTRTKHIVIGDIHGCAGAMFALLDACQRTPEDEVISVGDLVDRGPSPEAVVRFFMNDPNATVVMGNHEDKHVRIRSGELVPGPGHLATQHQLGDFYDEAVDFMATLPLSMERAGHFICHGGVLPGTPLAEQPRSALLRGKMPWMRNIFDTRNPWWNRYEGDTPIVYGHASTRDGDIRRVGNTWGIDTGAGRGGPLTALILPERRVVSVPSEHGSSKEYARVYADALEVLAAKHADTRARRRRPARAR